MKIRRVQPHEYLLLKRLRLEALAESPGVFCNRLVDEKARPDQEWMLLAEQHARSQQATTMLAIKQRKAIGLIGAFFTQAEHPRAYVASLWVHPQERGQSVGRHLVAVAEQWLQHRGAQQVYAWVVSSNRSAYLFYQHLGYLALRESRPLPSDPSETETLFQHQLFKKISIGSR